MTTSPRYLAYEVSISESCVQGASDMKTLSSLALASISSMALAGQASPPVTQPVTQQYEYATRLDIKRVISLSDIPPVCEVVPATMTYEDHQGKVHVIEYRVMGQGCSQG